MAFVIFGTWGCLTSSTGDPTAQRTMLIALIGAVVMVVALIARGVASRLAESDLVRLD